VNMAALGPRGWARRNSIVFFMLLYAIVYTTMGIIFYTQVEGWTFSECIYFIVIVISTVGYGDIVPTKDASKIFTSFYVLMGAGFFTFIVGVNARQSTVLSTERANLIRLESMLAMIAPRKRAPGRRRNSRRPGGAGPNPGAAETHTSGAANFHTSVAPAPGRHSLITVGPANAAMTAVEEELTDSVVVPWPQHTSGVEREGEHESGSGSESEGESEGEGNGEGEAEGRRIGKRNEQNADSDHDPDHNASQNDDGVHSTGPQDGLGGLPVRRSPTQTHSDHSDSEIMGLSQPRKLQQISSEQVTAAGKMGRRDRINSLHAAAMDISNALRAAAHDGTSYRRNKGRSASSGAEPSSMDRRHTGGAARTVDDADGARHSLPAGSVFIDEAEAQAELDAMREHQAMEDPSICDAEEPHPRPRRPTQRRAIMRHTSFSRVEYRRWLPESVRFLLKAILIMTILITCGIIFATTYLGFNSVDAFYWSVATGFSVGFGDLVPTTNARGEATNVGALWFAIFYIIAFIVFMLQTLAWIADWLARRGMRRELHNMLSVGLSRSLLRLVDVDNVSTVCVFVFFLNAYLLLLKGSFFIFSFDRLNDGRSSCPRLTLCCSEYIFAHNASQDGRVDKAEWLGAVLVMNDLLHPKMVRRIMDRFDELDRDGDGVLSARDLANADAIDRENDLQQQESPKSRRRVPQAGRSRSAKRSRILSELAEDDAELSSGESEGGSHQHGLASSPAGEQQPQTVVDVEPKITSNRAEDMSTMSEFALNSQLEQGGASQNDRICESNV
jgi:hypothetical protein